MQLPHVSTGWLISLAIATVVEILLPLALALYVSRRWRVRWRVRWRYFWYGVAVFTAVQLVTRVPAVYVLDNVLASQLKASQSLLWGWLFLLALTAALFEEVGRYFGYRIFMGKEKKTWPRDDVRRRSRRCRVHCSGGPAFFGPRARQYRVHPAARHFEAIGNAAGYVA